MIHSIMFLVPQSNAGNLLLLLRLLRRPAPPVFPPWRLECLHRRRPPPRPPPQHFSSSPAAAPGASGFAAAAAAIAGIDTGEGRGGGAAHVERLTDAMLLEMGSAPSHVQARWGVGRQRLSARS